MTILEAQGISKTYRVADRPITVLDEVFLAVRKGEFLVIKGESGSGKSTLLRYSRHRPSRRRTGSHRRKGYHRSGRG